MLIAVAFAVKRHYLRTARELRRLDELNRGLRNSPGKW